MPKKKEIEGKEEEKIKVDEKVEKKTEAEIEKAKKELEKKAKKLAEKIEIKDKKDIKGEVEKVKEEKKKKAAAGILFPLDDYVKYSAHLGTKAVTPHMRQFVYRRRADGIAVLNTTFIDQGIKDGADYLQNFKPEDIFLACKRESGWEAVKKFSEVTGIKVFTKKYPAGIITNIKLEDFFETELIIICDPWLDKNALSDAIKVRVPVIALCDTNNLTTGVTKIVPCNNKAEKSIGLVLYLLAKEYLKSQGKKEEAGKLKLEEFTGVTEEEVEQVGREKKRKGAREGV